MKLIWGDYKHYPYERQLALREAEALIGVEMQLASDGEVRTEKTHPEAARALTYFSSFSCGSTNARTQQSLLETSVLQGRRRQATRYSVHGLHEYKGKFNPQVCRALINILGLKQGDRLLDPFCGSGTTLVEAAHLGVEGLGFDLNPLAVFIANAKLAALRVPAARLGEVLVRIVSTDFPMRVTAECDDRLDYLGAWFEPEILFEVEQLRAQIVAQDEDVRPFFLVIASDLLRAFSLQEPADLRIRRRESANASEPFMAAFERSALAAIRKLALAQEVVGTDLLTGRASLHDIRTEIGGAITKPADGAITSPPYATALPYIDTQRLSLVWLGLLTPEQLRTREAQLIGSRELSTLERRGSADRLSSNEADLPDAQVDFCQHLQNSLSEGDGFRRRAVPLLFYRYCSDMKKMLFSVAGSLVPSAPFALIVGHNHTVLGGTRIEIDTPHHLTSIAQSAGWKIEECVPLQTYQRFSLHSSNAVTRESLIILRSPPYHAGATPSGNQQAPRLTV